ncbi:MAG: Trp family transcriptional regulator [bacterium]|nr:Trp family transcriptional regulator [bacterium]
MPRKQPKHIEPAVKEKLLDDFWTMISLLKTKDEVRNFFKDLLSETEAIMLSRRIEIAKRLLSGQSYGEICREISTSPNTVASVHGWLQSGFGGYEKLIPRLDNKVVKQRGGERSVRTYREPFSWPWIRKKYPLHFLLVNMLLGDDLVKPIEKGKTEKKKRF